MDDREDRHTVSELNLEETLTEELYEEYERWADQDLSGYDVEYMLSCESLTLFMAITAL